MIKPNVRAMTAYSVPRDFTGAKLNQNESPLDVPLEIKEKIFERLKSAEWNRYPQARPERLIGKIAAYANFPENGTLVGSSSNELIQTIILACCDSGDRLVTVNPTFSVYRRAAEVMNIETIEVPLNSDFSFDVPALIKTIQETPGVKVIFLASPNNPTGTVMDMQDIAKTAASTSSLLVMDEAYFEFYGKSAMRLVEEYGNIVVLRTFSKALQAAGIRLGYLLGRPETVKHLEKVKLPFSVGVFQQAAGEVILENVQFLDNNIKTIILERERVFTSLLSVPFIEPIRSEANFILFRSNKCPADQLYASLANRGVLVRAYAGGRLKDMLRVSIGTSSENTLFLDTLREVVL
jgi:histidinol-phosphate aminotransferase